MLKLTDAKRRMLENIRDGRPAGTGFPSGKYAGQASVNTIVSLWHDGLIEWSEADDGPAYRLTPAGQAALR